MKKKSTPDNQKRSTSLGAIQKRCCFSHWSACLCRWFSTGSLGPVLDASDQEPEEEFQKAKRVFPYQEDSVSSNPLQLIFFPQASYNHGWLNVGHKSPVPSSFASFYRRERVEIVPWLEWLDNDYVIQTISIISHRLSILFHLLLSGKRTRS